MKIWAKENGNTVIEFERDQNEISRVANILGIGARFHREESREHYRGQLDIHVRTAISGYLTKVMIDTYLVGSNYTQEFGTVEKPKEYHIKDFIASALAGVKHPGWNVDKWVGTELSVMREYPWDEII